MFIDSKRSLFASSRSIRTASVVGLTEATVVRACARRVQSLPPPKQVKFVNRFNQAVNGGENVFRRWLRSMTERHGSKLADLDEQLLREEVFARLSHYISH